MSLVLSLVVYGTLLWSYMGILGYGMSVVASGLASANRTESSNMGIGLSAQCGTEPMIVDCLSTTDPRWKALLDEVPHDIYHLPQYVEVSAAYEDAEPAAFLMQEGSCFCLIPLLIRRLPIGLTASPDWRDAKSPYGYAAPLFRGDACWIDKALVAFTRECQIRKVISVFSSMHPLLTVPHSLEHYGQLVKHSETVYVDLSLTEARLWSQTRERFRSYITRLHREGFQVRFDDWSAYNDFAIYL